MAKSAIAAGMANAGIGEKIKSWPQRIKGFYVDVRTEMKHVTAPSRKEVQGTTTVVIITVFLFGLYFFIIDYVIQHGVTAVMQYFR